MSLRPISLKSFGFFRSALGHLRQFGRHLGELHHVAVRDLALRLGVADRALVGGQFIGRHLPLAGDRVDQHLAGLRARQAQRHVVGRHRHARERHLRAGEHLVRAAVNARVARRELALHLRPVGVELFGEDQRQRSEHALPHLRTRAEDGDGVVGRDRHPGVELGAFGGIGLRGAAEDRAAQREREGETCRGLDEAAAGHFGGLNGLVHGQASFAARWMARTMRG